jgi:hypothetical protein
MMELTETRLVQVARNYYPTGFPFATDDYSQDLHPYQRTAEYARWQKAWREALAWPEWKILLGELRGPFGNNRADCTRTVSACRHCCVYVQRTLPDGATLVTRVAAAASILAPLYVTYCTTELRVDRGLRNRHFSFEPTKEVLEHTSQLAALVEQILGYQPFPRHLANVTVPGIRVPYMNEERAPPLLDALFDGDLASLP